MNTFKELDNPVHPGRVGREPLGPHGGIASPQTGCGWCGDENGLLVQGAGKRVKRTFMKQLQLGRAPECLCIHLKRTVWLSDGSLCKDNTRVSFPARLDISTVMKVQGRQVTYTSLRMQHW